MWYKIFLVAALVGHIHGQNNESPAVLLSNPEILSQPSSEIMILMRETVIPTVREISARVFPNRGAKLNEIASTLKAFTALSQAPIVAALKPFNVEFKTFWIANRIYVKNAPPALVKLLQTMPQIGEIRLPKFPSFPPLNPIEGTPPNGTEWNVQIVRAPEVWEMGNDGSGVIVGGIDTGVRYTHVAIKDNWVGAENRGWFDPWYNAKTPQDFNGHGTHTIATVLGTTGTGIAPGAKWSACRACETAGCPEKHLIACGEFMMCPTDPEGKSPRCDNAPNIVTNSWGGGNNEPFYDEVIAAWNAGGILPIFAIGNDGPKCNTAASPGDRDGVLAVGATDKDDKIAKFSSRGPRHAADGKIKPEVVAPGHKVNSAFSFSDKAYRVLSGTSMACPAAAGAAALLVAKNKDLTLEDLMHYFYKSANKSLPPSGTSCGATPDNEYPNEVYGHGRIDVYEAYKLMLSEPPPSAGHMPTVKSTNVK